MYYDPNNVHIKFACVPALHDYINGLTLIYEN